MLSRWNDTPVLGGFQVPSADKMVAAVLVPSSLIAVLDEVPTLVSLLEALWPVAALLPELRLVRPWPGLAAWDTGVERPGCWPPI